MNVPPGVARRIGLLLFGLGLILTTATALPAKTTLKVAVVIPEGSAWVKVLEEMVSEIRAQTQGEVDFIIYPGGVSGDEADVLRKMQANRLQAAGLSGVGLGIVLPEIRVLESPLLWNADEAVDAVREQMFDTFAAAFEKKGFTLLGFTEGGWVYLFSARDISRPEEFRSCKMWLWQGDRTAELFLNTSGVRTTPLHVADVNTGLETGMIDSFYAPPLAAVAFQWYVRVRYMLDLPITNATAAFLMNRKSMEALPADHQKILRSVARKYCQKLVALTRQDNREAMAILKAQGLQVVTPTAQLAREIEENARKAHAQSIPDLFPQALFDQVERVAIQSRGPAKDKNPRNSSAQ
jgi:TRAP-type C4-dicarboxylate transport system substrate-binding protein